MEPIRTSDACARSTVAMTGTNLKIIPGRAEEMPVEDASLDVVVGTMMLCSVRPVDRRWFGWEGEGQDPLRWKGGKWGKGWEVGKK